MKSETKKKLKSMKPMTLPEMREFIRKLVDELPAGTTERKSLERLWYWLHELAELRTRVNGRYAVPTANMSGLVEATNDIVQASIKLDDDIYPPATDAERQAAIDRITRAAEKFSECKPRNCDVYTTRQHVFDQLEKMCQGKPEATCADRNCFDCVAEWMLAEADKETCDP